MGDKHEVNEMCNVPDDILLTLQQDVREIKTALLGNQYNDTGLIKRQCDSETEMKAIKERNEKEFNKMSSRIDRIYWTAGGISFGVSFIISIILFILNLKSKI
jgi:hypothetical protein